MFWQNISWEACFCQDFVFKNKFLDILDIVHRVVDCEVNAAALIMRQLTTFKVGEF